MVLVEGAGSPAEINLRAHDIANMGFAEAVDLPVWLVADIERGGVFAQIVGTMELLAPTERERVTGVAVNRFRGDVALLTRGLDWLRDVRNIPVVGVMPYLKNLRLDAEDSLARRDGDGADDGLKVVVPLLPRISNPTDFEPLADHPQVTLTYVKAGTTFPPADLVILPGSKNVISDLGWIREQGYDTAIIRHLRYGGRLLGVCGGYQMLGSALHDPHGMEGTPGSCDGLGLLDLQTTLAPEKRLANVTGRLTFDDADVAGYEIHAGVTDGPALRRPFSALADGPDGAISDDGGVAGTYLHGLFDRPEALTALLRWAGLTAPVAVDRAAERMNEIDRLADAMEAHLDLTGFWRHCGVKGE